MGLPRKAKDSAFPLARVGKKRRTRIDLLPYILVAPAVLLVLAITIYPAIYATRLSLTNAELTNLRSVEFIGLKNYREAFGDDILGKSVLGTLRYVLIVGSLQMLLALPVALLLNTSFTGRGLVRGVIVIPWVIQAAVISIIWRFMVDSNFGVINDILVRLRIIPEYLAWMADPLRSFVVVVAASMWAGFSFFAVTLLGVLQTIPDDLYEAARVDGAGAWQRFRYVTLPLILPTVLLLMLLRTIGLAHSVDLIFLMTGGGPVYHNYTVAVYSFLLTWQRFEIAYPAALALMLSVVLLAASAVYIRFIQRSREWM